MCRSLRFNDTVFDVRLKSTEHQANRKSGVFQVQVWQSNVLAIPSSAPQTHAVLGSY